MGNEMVQVGGSNAMTEEQWHPVFGYEGIYAVSNFGKVKSLSRIVIGKKKQTVPERILQQMDNGHGYLSVRLWSKGIGKIAYVHRLVLIAFEGEPPPGMECCHNDGDAKNNHLSNLRWDTKIKNHADKFIHGTIGNGEKARAAKLTAEKVKQIRSRLSAGEEQATVAGIYGIAQPTVSNILNRKTWKHI